MTIVCLLLNLYIIALFGRIILSWFPMEPGSGMARVYELLFTITEPVLGPLRRLIPPMRMGSMAMDWSPLIVLIAIRVLQAVVLGC